MIKFFSLEPEQYVDKIYDIHAESISIDDNYKRNVYKRDKTLPVIVEMCQTYVKRFKDSGGTMCELLLRCHKYSGNLSAVREINYQAGRVEIQTSLFYEFAVCLLYLYESYDHFKKAVNIQTNRDDIIPLIKQTILRKHSTYEFSSYNDSDLIIDEDSAYYQIFSPANCSLIVSAICKFNPSLITIADPNYMYWCIGYDSIFEQFDPLCLSNLNLNLSNNKNFISKELVFLLLDNFLKYKPKTEKEDKKYVKVLTEIVQRLFKV